ncbi:MAG: type II toxin-antitoxin system VapC family toxin [Chloroflexi bacterium]|nr:MAG: type II toxin-antitoxin system VapC family toxin [Chloroflexota bacterium]
MAVLLDASALLALLYDERGAAEVRAQIDEARLLAVNLEEVLGVLLKDGMPVDIARHTVDTLGLSIAPYTEAMAWRSAELRRRLPSGLGIADRACLAAAAVLGTPVLIADALWRKAAEVFGVDVRVIR